MEPTPNELKNAASAAGNYATDKARQVANTVSEQMHKQEIKAGELYQEARERAEDALDISVDFVKRHPVSTVAGAVAIGFIAGMMLRRSRY